MARADALVKSNRTGISLDDDPNRAETSGPGRCPREQQAANSRSQQRRLDKELQQVCIRAGDFELGKPHNRRIALGHLKVGGLQFVRTERQFGTASRHECGVVSPDSLRTQAQLTQASEFAGSGVAELDHRNILSRGGEEAQQSHSRCVAPDAYARHTAAMASISIMKSGPYSFATSTSVTAGAAGGVTEAKN